MFEDSLLESGGKLQTQSKNWAFAAFLLNSSVLMVMILIPILHPEALPRQAMAMLLVAPPPPPGPPVTQTKAAQPAQTTKVRSIVDMLLTAPLTIPTDIKMVNDGNDAGTASPYDVVGSVGTGDLKNGAAMSFMTANVAQPRVIPEPKAKPVTKLAVSSGVAQGYLLNKIAPSYPAIAKAAGIQGTVVLSATISRNGTIENLNVLSGPQILQQAALDAVRGWKYKPYYLNGEPVEIETQVNVIFSLGR